MKDSDDRLKIPSDDLNLGLFDLLHDPVVAESLKATPLVGELKSEATETVTQAAALSEEEQLCRDAQWTTLILKSEAVLADSSVAENSVERLSARTYWLYAQLETQFLPASVLAAPLESVLESLRSGQQTLPNAVEPRLIEITRRTLVTLHSNNDQNIAQLIEEQLKNLPAPFQNILKGSEVSEVAVVTGAEGGSEIYLRTEKASSTASRIIPFSKPFRILAAMMVTGVSVSAGYFWLTAKPPEGPTFPGMDHSGFASPPLDIPGPVSIAQLSQLDALFYDLKNRSDAVAAVPSVVAAIPAEPVVVQKISPQPKVAIDTNGPTEKPEIRDLRVKKNDAHSARGNLVTGDSMPVSPTFEKFNTSRKYEVINPTSVMRSASTRSEPIEGLKVGDQVRAEGQEGYWIRIRSSAGATGYILAQDLNPVNDW